MLNSFIHHFIHTQKLCSFSMPDVSSIGLGGGSRVRVKTGKEDPSPVITVGPEWVFMFTFNFFHASD